MTSNHPRYKFLTRNLRLSYTTTQAFRQVIIKNFYLKNLIDSREYEEDTQMFLALKRKKALKTLKQFKISVIAQTPFDECLKTAKNLKNFCIESQNDNSNPHKVLQTLRKLPFQIEKITIQIFQEGSINVQNLYKVSSSLGRFPNLCYFTRDYAFEKVDIEKETRALSKSTSRLRNIKAIDYYMCSDDLQEFQLTMKNDFVYSQIHGLRITIYVEVLENFHTLQEFIQFEEFDEKTKDFNFEALTKSQSQAYKSLLKDIDNDNNEIIVDSYVKQGVSEEFMMSCLMREEMILIYHLKQFPNLRRLDLIKEACYYPLGSFVIDAFESLKNLKELNIDIWNVRPLGTIYLWQGLLKLPLLQKFTLRIPFLKNKDWEILGKFLTQQKNLEIFGFEISRNSMNQMFLKQNQFLKRFLQNLNDKPLLKHLELKSFCFSPYTISEGLESLNNLQLQTLNIEASDKGFDCPKKPIKAVQGLCSFIKSQNESLRNLELSLENVFLPIETIFSSLNKLIHLKTLTLSMNSPQTVDLVSFLLHFKNLEDFTFKFEIDNPKEQTHLWFIHMLIALNQLPKLRNLEIKGPNHLALVEIQDQIANILYQMRQIKEIKFHFWNASHQDLEELFNMIEYVNQRQSCKSEFMF